MPETTETPAASPTGETLPIPKWAWKAAACLVGFAAVFLEVDIFPDHTMADKICDALVKGGAFLGMVSPGWRK